MLAAFIPSINNTQVMVNYSKAQNRPFQLTKTDIPTAAGVLTRAFLDDPFTTYTFGKEKARSEKLFFLMALTLRYSIRFGVVYATPGMEGVAAWMPPASGRESNWRMLQVGALKALWRIGLKAIRSYLAVEHLTDRLHERYAPEAHWYLSQLGVEPKLQGQGYGKQLLAPTLEQIDRERMAVYLETLNPKAIHFYQNLGFRVCEQVCLPNAGPPMWVMRREPQLRA